MATKKSTTLASGGATCPVEAIALRQAVLWEAYEATDNKDNAMKDSQHGTLQDAIDDNFRASSWLYPTSAVGAMFQVANAMEGVGDLIENDHDDRLIILERARRCLHGVMRFLEQTTARHFTWIGPHPRAPTKSCACINSPPSKGEHHDRRRGRRGRGLAGSQGEA